MTDQFPVALLRDVATRVERPESPTPGRSYRQIGVQLWGRGAYERGALEGGATRYKTLSRVEAGDIIVNKIWARNGSVAVVPASLAGSYVSGEFPTFSPLREKLEPRWFHWYCKVPALWAQCEEKSRGTSGKNRIRPERFLEIEIPLPSIEEQRRLVSRIEMLTAKVEEAARLRKETFSDQRELLLGAFAKVMNGANRLRMKEVAPLIRRPVKVEPLSEYRELGIRSFGKGTFHKPPTTGTALAGKRVFEIKPGDLLFNVVFAWEGAVAIARPEDDNRVGSHRFLTCVPKDGLALSSFLCFYFLTDLGLEDLRNASPGGAGRNRTLGIEALAEIEVPVPPMGKQQWFASILGRAGESDHLRKQVDQELEALIPSVLSRAFRGQL